MGNYIEDAGAHEFARALKRNGVLEVLSLNGNEVRDQKVQDKIRDLLKRNKAGLGPAPGEAIEEGEGEESSDSEPGEQREEEEILLNYSVEQQEEKPLAKITISEETKEKLFGYTDKQREQSRLSTRVIQETYSSTAERE